MTPTVGSPPRSPTNQGTATGRRFGWRIRLLALAVSSAFAFGIAEVGLRLAGIAAPPRHSAGNSESGSGNEFFSYHPTLGWELIPGASTRLTSAEFDVAVRINAAGQRSDSVAPVERTPGQRRVVVLGDSFTFGHGVESAEAWPAQLAAELAATEVVNLGVTGTGTDQQLLFYEQRGATYQPDLVLLGFFVADTFRNHRTNQLGYPKPRFRHGGDGKLELANVPVPQLAPGARLSTPWYDHLRLTALFVRRGSELLEHLGASEAWPLTAAIVRRLAQNTTANGAALGVVVIPKDQLIYGSGLRRWVNQQAHDRLLGILAAQGIPHLDLTTALRDSAVQQPGERLYFSADGHWTPAGHRAAAVAVARWVDQRWPAAAAPTAP